MNRLFWGLFFVLLDLKVTLGSAAFGLLPDFFGYFLLMKGMEALEEENRHFAKGRHWAFALVLLNVILYVADLLDLQTMDRVRVWCVGLAGHGAGIYVLYKMIAGIRQMEEDRRWDLHSGKLKAMWLIQTVMGTIAYLLGWVPLVGIISGAASSVTAVCLLAAMYGTGKRFAQEREKEREL